MSSQSSVPHNRPQLEAAELDERRGGRIGQERTIASERAPAFKRKRRQQHQKKGRK